MPHRELAATGRELIRVHDATGAAGVEKGLEPHDERDEAEHPEHPQKHADDESREHEGRAAEPHGIEHGEGHRRDKRDVKQARYHHQAHEGEDRLGALEHVVVGHEEVAGEACNVVRRRGVGRVGRDDQEGQGEARAGVRGIAEPVARQGEQSQPDKTRGWKR